ncbi:MAG: methyltransferase domain-containing protein [Rhodobacteraceae bacterium]|nr:methyltransferase domain-containing protein [Paracoccaceae bacterium]
MLSEPETGIETTRRGQLTGSAAEVYETFFLPALFAQFADPVAAAAGAAPGKSFLDVACGTGVLARAARSRAGIGAHVAGLDCNPGMLAVARARAPEIDWYEGRAEALPFPDAAFDAVASQFGIMFFEDRVAALREMWRVLAPGGGLAVAVWDAVETSPGYAAMLALLTRIFGPRTASALRAPFVLGDRAAFAALFPAAGIPEVTVETRPGTARFPSIEDWVRTDVKGWTLADLIDAEGYVRLRQAAARDLAEFAAPDGTVAFAAPIHLAWAVKPA